MDGTAAELAADARVIDAYLGVEDEALDDTRLQTGTVDLSLMDENRREKR